MRSDNPAAADDVRAGSSEGVAPTRTPGPQSDQASGTYSGNMRGKLLWLVAVAILVMASAAAATLALTRNSAPERMASDGLPRGPISYQEVSSHPEANLVFPGSSVVRKIGSGQLATFAGDRNPAFAGAIAATHAAPEAVNAFYRQWMLQHGWTPYDVFLVGGQLSNEGYKRGPRERFTIGIDDPKSMSKSISSPIPKGETVYEFRYFLPPAS